MVEPEPLNLHQFESDQGRIKGDYMKIECSFSGCSCGCTPYEYKTFIGPEPDIYIAIANWARDYTTSGPSPFRKLSIPKETITILEKISPLWDEKSTLSRQKRSIEIKIEGLKKAAELLETEIPQLKKEEISNDEKTLETITQRIQQIIDQISKELHYDAEVTIKDDEDDDDD